MKILLTAIVIIFSHHLCAQADDVKDFEIDEMSIGDSLLEYKSPNEIEKAIKNKLMYPDSNFAVIVFNPNAPQPYDYIEVVYDINNKKYIIDALTGLVNYPNRYDECKKSKKNISGEFKLMFSNAEIYENESPHYYFPDSIVDQTDFYPKSGGFVRVSCTDWSEKLFKENEWVDNLKVSIGSVKFSDFLN